MTDRSLVAVRLRVSLLFFFYGFTFASWASRIPNIQQNLHLSEPALGAVLLSMPVGSFLTLPLSGYFTSKFGSRKMVIVSFLIYTSLLSCIGWAHSIATLSVSLFLFGSSGNMMNIAVNTQAISLEKLYQKTIISAFHGMWSVAGLVAASLGTFMIGRHFPVGYHFFLVSALSVTNLLICAPFLLPDNDKITTKRPFFVRPDKAFLGLGMIAFCSMICQGAMFDWSGIYFKKVLVTDARFIGFGYTAFMVSMTSVRFITDWLTHRAGFRKIMIWCGAFTAFGLVGAVIFPYLIPATVCLFLVGIGVSPAVPLVFSAAATAGRLTPAVAIAAVSSVGFIGLMIGPPMIGFIAGLTSLKTSFLLLSLFGAAISVFGFLYKKP